MNILKNISLKPFNTFGIESFAQEFVDIESEEDLIHVLEEYRNAEKFILGGGSNILLTKNIDALVIHINIKGKEVIHEEKNSVIVKIKAGENWHDFVIWCIENNYGGVENLSLIPGNVGTAPIQNIGAYGVEIKDVFVECEAVNVKTFETKIYKKNACNFEYRNSIFKNDLKGKFIITSVTFKLSKDIHTLNTSYGDIQSELKQKNIFSATLKDVSNAVIKIRQSKLPDPREIGNSGSFFKNPVISETHFKKLKGNFPDIPYYIVTENEIKIPAGWLIEKAGFKGKRFGDYGVHKKQALVLVNYSSANGKDIYKLSQLIQRTIKRLFNINLEAEVNVI